MNEAITKSSEREMPEYPSRRRFKIPWQYLSLPYLLFIAIPIIAMILRISPASFIKTIKMEQVLQAISLSLLTSLVTVGLTVVFGTPVAYLLHRRKRSRLYRFVDTLIDLPTVLPPAVAGVALLMAFGRRGLLGAWLTSLGISIPFTPLAVVLAQMFIASPLYIKSAALGFSSVDCELKKAAALDGANRWLTFRYIMIPMSWMSLTSGIVMTWARALGEFGATIIFAGNFPGRTQTMPLAIYLGFELDMNVAITLSLILILFSFLTLLLVKGLLHNHVDVSAEEEDD